MKGRPHHNRYVAAAGNHRRTNAGVFAEYFLSIFFHFRMRGLHAPAKIDAKVSKIRDLPNIFFFF